MRSGLLGKRPSEAAPSSSCPSLPRWKYSHIPDTRAPLVGPHYDGDGGDGTEGRRLDSQQLLGSYPHTPPTCHIILSAS